MWASTLVVGAGRPLGAPACEQTGWSGRRAGGSAGSCTCRTFTPKDVTFTPSPAHARVRITTKRDLGKGS